MTTCAKSAMHWPLVMHYCVNKCTVASPTQVIDLDCNPLFLLPLCVSQECAAACDHLSPAPSLPIVQNLGVE